MVDLLMLSPVFEGSARERPTGLFSLRRHVPADTILFASRRPATLTYYSGLVSTGLKVANFPWYWLGWRQEKEKLHVQMAEGVVFEGGRKKVPTKAYLDIQCRGQDINVYSVRLLLRAKFSGLRGFMYYHRILSSFLLTTAFYMCELMFATVTFLSLRASLKSSGDDEAAIKTEEETGSAEVKTENDGADTEYSDLSDTPRDFPTYGRQRPLRYDPTVKSENSEDLVSDEVHTHPRAVEADDESEDPVDVGAAGSGASGSGQRSSFNGEGTALARWRRSQGRRGSE